MAFKPNFISILAFDSLIFTLIQLYFYLNTSFSELFAVPDNWFNGILDVLFLACIVIVVAKFYLKRIKKKKIELEKTVKERTQEIIAKNEEIIAQKEEILRQQAKITEFYSEVTQSIHTAQRIQQSFLPPESFIKKYLPSFFSIYIPKDIVSGDFYWMHVKYDKIYLAAVDCTGHGVAGAFMSIIGGNLLKQIVIENATYNASEILKQLSIEVVNTLHQNMEDSITSDGMDMSLCIIDTDNGLLQFAGANNPLYVVNNGELTQIQGDKIGIGILKGKTNLNFTNHVIELKAEDRYFIFSDGFASQFGGDNGEEKFKYTRFRDLIAKSSHLSIEDQKKEIITELQKWRQNVEQTDDIMLLGFEAPPINEEAW